MKKGLLLSILLVLLIALVLPGIAYARGLVDDKVVFGGTFTLKSGETIDGNLMVFGGVATLESDTEVTGDVVVMGGTVDAAGTIGGDVVAIGGQVNLASTAVVEGNVAEIGATVNQETGAQVEGNFVTQLEIPLALSVVEGIRLPATRMVGFQGLLGVAWFFLKLILWMILAAVVVLIMPERTQRAAHAAASQPILSGGLGFLTAVILPPVLVVLGITICLLPVALVALVLAVLVWAFGMVALGYELGKRLATLARQEWAPAVNAGLGAFVLMLILNTVGTVVPCVGWVLPFLVGCVGFGAVVLTRVGSQSYPPQVEMMPGSLAAVPPPSPVEQTPPPVDAPPASPDSSSDQQG
jgi:hypothetical protein